MGGWDGLAGSSQSAALENYSRRAWRLEEIRPDWHVLLAACIHLNPCAQVTGARTPWMLFPLYLLPFFSLGLVRGSGARSSVWCCGCTSVWRSWMLEDSWVWSSPPEGSPLEDTAPPLPLCPSEQPWHFQDREVGASVRHRPKPGISSLLTTMCGTESVCFHHHHKPQTLESPTFL